MYVQKFTMAYFHSIRLTKKIQKIYKNRTLYGPDEKSGFRKFEIQFSKYQFPANNSQIYLKSSQFEAELVFFPENFVLVNKFH